MQKNYLTNLQQAYYAFPRKYSLGVLLSSIVIIVILFVATFMLFTVLNQSIGSGLSIFNEPVYLYLSFSSPGLIEDTTNVTKDKQRDMAKGDPELKLNPWWLTGFSDAESSFSVQLNKKNSGACPYQVQPVFAIKLHYRDLSLLEQIQTFFKGKGSITINNNKNSVMFRVSKLEDIIGIIIPHFKEYPLITNKSIDFSQWCKIIDIVNEKNQIRLK